LIRGGRGGRYSERAGRDQAFQGNLLTLTSRPPLGKELVMGSLKQIEGKVPAVGEEKRGTSRRCRSDVASLKR